MQGFGGACSRGDKVPAAFAALNAVAGNDGAQRPVHPVAHRAAQAAAMGRRVGPGHGLFPDTKARKNHAQQIIRTEGAGDFIEGVLRQPQFLGQQIERLRLCA